MHDEHTTWTRRMVAGLTTGIALVGAGALGSTVYLTQAVLADGAEAPTTSTVTPADRRADDEAAADPATGSGAGSAGSGSTGSGTSPGSGTSTGSGTTDSGVSAGTGSGSSSRTSGS
ncbi:hypothetical protein [Clavibacter sp. MX14-G9D]|uniref:hypothetical protein n=1 Tax=Clavibacter sp. MX14-G9D TaxID=3064656 RepID=UPI00293F45F5|nr:hypothetical protein [Clavibacter sp. MX14-G9D]